MVLIMGWSLSEVVLYHEVPRWYADMDVILFSCHLQPADVTLPRHHGRCDKQELLSTRRYIVVLLFTGV